LRRCLIAKAGRAVMGIQKRSDLTPTAALNREIIYCNKLLLTVFCIKSGRKGNS
jgi:hypothetical protein